MHKPDWVGDRKLGYCTVLSVSLSVDTFANWRAWPGEDFVQGIVVATGKVSTRSRRIPCKRLGERVSVKDDRSTRTVNINMVCQLRRLSQPAAWRQAHQLLPARSPELQNSQRQQRFHPRIHPHATVVCNSL